MKKKVHELKIWPKYYNDIVFNGKNFEVRKNDRDFCIGDYLELIEFDPEMRGFTGRSVVKEVAYILDGGQFGIEPGYVVMGFK